MHCTGYVQPMDTIINKLVKDKIGDILLETLVYESVVWLMRVMILVLDTIELQSHMQ